MIWPGADYIPGSLRPPDPGLFEHTFDELCLGHGLYHYIAERVGAMRACLTGPIRSTTFCYAPPWRTLSICEEGSTLGLVTSCR